MIRSVANHITITTTSSSSSSSSSTSGSSSAVAAEQKLFLMWVPSYRASFKVDYGGWRNWSSIGFDWVTLQPNWAFANIPTGLTSEQKFALVANATKCLGMGVEMELPMTVRNPFAGNWTESFDAYEAASHKYSWGREAMRTWYYGNAYNLMRLENPAYYKKLHTMVTSGSGGGG